MAAKKTVKAACKNVRPLMSLDCSEARIRALGLYRAFYRYIPYIEKYFDVEKSREDYRMKIRDCFYRNACISDVRVIDMLILKGYMELKEIDHQWQQKSHVMANWNPSAEPRPNNFIDKFLAGVD